MCQNPAKSLAVTVMIQERIPNVNVQTGNHSHQCPGLLFGTLLRIRFEGFSTILTNLIGLEEGLHLIIKTPPIPEIGTKLFQKNNIIIQYLYSGQVFGFRTTLLGLVNDPFRYAILAYPTKVEKVNIRKHERINCMLPAKLQMSRETFAVLIEDISEGGCYFEVTASKDGKFPLMRIGEEAQLIVTLPGMMESITLIILVRTIKCDIRTMKIGVQFKRPDKRSDEVLNFEAIKNYIEHFQMRDWSET